MTPARRSLLCALLILVFAASRASRPLPSMAAEGAARVVATPNILRSLPLAFEENVGQTDAAARFVARGREYNVFLTGTDAVVALPADAASIRLGLAGANRRPRITPLDRQPAAINYFRGSESSRWQTNVPSYSRVRYEQVYPGIDLEYYGREGQLEYDFLVGRGADPSRIQIDLAGGEAIGIDAAGDLTVGIAGRSMRLHKPVAYQDIRGHRRPVAARYVTAGDRAVRLALDTYDLDEPLVIDPVLSYSTYFGGAGEDYAFGIAVDAAGNMYVAGTTNSTDFPTTAGAFSRTYSSVGSTTPPGGDAFVLKLNPSGSLVYATYLGGSASDIANAIAVDSSGNVYVTGSTGSTNFPTTSGAVQPHHGNYPGSSLGDAFVTKLDATGSSVVYSTYLGGLSLTHGYGIAVDAAGNAYVTGDAWYSFNTTNPLPQSTAGPIDAFVVKINPSGSGLIYSKLIGGSNYETGYAIALDASGNAYVTGDTDSLNFPTSSAADATYGGSGDSFVVKLGPTGSVVYSSYVGGSDGESARGIAVDGSGNAYITGGTSSSDFVTTAGALRTQSAGFSDAFVTKYSPTGAVVYSTYLGGAGSDSSWAIAVDSAGTAYVTGDTASSNFPVVAAIQSTLSSAGNTDVFVSRLNAPGSALLFSTFLGGTSRTEEARALALDAAGVVYITGRTRSIDWPTASPVQSSNKGGSDLFVARISPTACTFTLAPTAKAFAAAAGTGTFTVTPSASDCIWTAAASNSFITVTSGSPGAGNGTVAYSVAALSSGSRTGTITIGTAVHTVSQTVTQALPLVTVDKKTLVFAVTTTGTGSARTAGPITPAQPLHVAQTGPGAVSWTATTNQTWLSVSPASGTAPAAVTATANVAGGIPSGATATAKITFTFTGASTTTATVDVTLNITDNGSSPPPIGTVDTPVEGSVLAGSVAVTGWSLDNIGVKRVEIWRDPQPGEPTPTFTSSPGDPRIGKIFISNATFVDGARPDVEGLYVSMPFAYRAGWGYLMLTWGLYNSGNGIYKLSAYAFDLEDHVTTLGTKSVTFSNNAATKPFGSIDTPGIGGDAGTSPNFGWGLTPKVNGAATCKIQSNGVQVSIDSGPLQPVVYGDNRTDIAGAFAGFSNSAGAGGHFLFDWSTLTNGPHTIGWLITDDCNRADGVGSRYFNVTNGTSLVSADSPSRLKGEPPLSDSVVSAFRRNGAADEASAFRRKDVLLVARGFGELPETVTAGDDGRYAIELQLGGRIELRLPRGYENAHQIVVGQVRGLPVGSSWDAASGTFYWQPAPGFLGRYRLVFSNGSERISVRVVVVP